jgi:hypothetical protein
MSALAQSGHGDAAQRRPLLGIKRTLSALGILQIFCEGGLGWAVARIKTSRRLFDSNQSSLVWAGGKFS